MRIRRLAALTCAATLLFAATDSNAGARKGLMATVGAGVGGTFFVTDEIVEDFRGPGLTVQQSDWARRASIPVDVRLGIGFTENLWIYGQARAYGLRYNNETVVNALVGPGFTYFLGPRPNELYVLGAIGVLVRGTPFNGTDEDPCGPDSTHTPPPDPDGDGTDDDEDLDLQYGFGLLGGMGIEFSKHWSVEVTFQWDITREEVLDFDLDTEAISLHVTLNLLIY